MSDVPQVDEVDRVFDMDPHTPGVGKSAFDCPQCGAYAQQEWAELNRRRGSRAGGYMALAMPDGWKSSRCVRCNDVCIWLDDKLIYPLSRVGPAPHEDMPESVRALYLEAREVASISRKSAAGLLRLALQVLIDELEPGNANISTKIGRLVAKGLQPQVQQAMDILRIVGNNAVHPGQIDLESDGDLTPGLFGLINLIVDQVIGRPKQLAELYGSLPPDSLAAIAKRDGT